MSYQDPNQQNPYPGSGQYSGYGQQPQPTDPYSGQQQGGYQQPNTGYQPPNASYQQPNPYGQQQQQYGIPGQTSIGMSQNTAAGLSYVFMWLSGLIIFLVEKQNRFVRFHALQSVMFFGSMYIISIVAGFLPYIGGVIGTLAWLVTIVGWIVLMINGFQGKYFKLPVIGDYAERYANQGTGGVPGQPPM